MGRSAGNSRGRAAVASASCLLLSASALVASGFCFSGMFGYGRLSNQAVFECPDEGSCLGKGLGTTLGTVGLFFVGVGSFYASSILTAPLLMGRRNQQGAEAQRPVEPATVTIQNQPEGQAQISAEPAALPSGDGYVLVENPQREMMLALRQ
jgi:hypothetical protein